MPERNAGKLTLQVLALKAIENAPPDPCRLGKHVVSATAIRDGREWARCGNCGQAVRLR